MIIEKDIIQGTPEWFSARLGNPGGSRMSQIVTNGGKLPSKSVRDAYLNLMAGEKITGERQESYKSADMENGNTVEPKARYSFTNETGLQVEQAGLIYPNELRQWHVSPDCLVVGKNKGGEFKCPKINTHIGYLRANKMPNEYKCQIQSSLACTDYDSWYFMSFYQGVEPFILEVGRDEPMITMIKEQVAEFIYDLNQIVKKYAA